MPIPILPVNVPSDDNSGQQLQQETPQYTGINYDMLSGFVKSNNEKKMKLSNSDASLLFTFWREGSVENEFVVVPERFSNSDVLRLKTLGFVVGDDTSKVRLTDRAREVIKTLVLHEENNFISNRVHKPYNEILAEQNKPGNIRLALDNK